jgi:hypothetical protein
MLDRKQTRIPTQYRWKANRETYSTHSDNLMAAHNTRRTCLQQLYTWGPLHCTKYQVSKFCHLCSGGTHFMDRNAEGAHGIDSADCGYVWEEPEVVQIFKSELGTWSK